MNMSFINLNDFFETFPWPSMGPLVMSWPSVNCIGVSTRAVFLFRRNNEVEKKTVETWRIVECILKKVQKNQRFLLFVLQYTPVLGIFIISICRRSHLLAEDSFSSSFLSCHQIDAKSWFSWKVVLANFYQENQEIQYFGKKVK